MSPPLQKLLETVNSEVKARLEQSLHNAVIIHLHREKPPVRMQRLWDVEVKIGRRATVQLQPNISITQIFDETGGKLLILGALGAGKTTTLLELAKDLIIRVEKDNNQPIPVIFDLLSWPRNNQTLTEWLVDELKSKYNINKKIGKQLIECQQIIPLLDGLDELDLWRQEACLEAINQFVDAENPANHLAVCTRLEEYKRCKSRLKLHGAIFLRPLTPQQVKQYLVNASSLQLWYSIEDDPNLMALAKTPLWLNMMTLAYDEILIHAWKRLSSKEERRNYLLNAYIRWMLTWKVSSRYFAKKEPRPEQMRPWIALFAKMMKQENKIELAADSINPNWLQNAAQKNRYRLGVGLTLGGIAGLGKLLLRLILWQDGYLPWNYRRFLGLANERLFLQQIGKRYRFTHEVLRDYLAQL
jgi:predicted NACHT family NTPase